jgi:hypothetical protein
VRLSTPGEALIFFMIRLIERLRAYGSAPAVDLMEYGRGLESFGGTKHRSGVSLDHKDH